MGTNWTAGEWKWDGLDSAWGPFRLQPDVIIPGNDGSLLIDAADAHLIAAAPDLYAELAEVLEWAVSEKAPLRDQEIASIRAALAKARGE